MKVKEIMTRPVICTGADTPTPDVVKLLAKHNISAVPVTDQDGTIVGLVSEYDLLSRTGRTAREIMSPGILSVTEDTDIEAVRSLLIERRIRRVPVMNGQKLVGIVSRSDIVKQMAVQWYCDVCGEPERGSRRPLTCRKCSAPGERFTQDPHPPGV
jgi:CBS domain-containing protein